VIFYQFSDILIIQIIKELKSTEKLHFYIKVKLSFLPYI